MVDTRQSRRASLLRVMNKAQRDGFEAGENGLAPFNNPYDEGSAKAADWRKGWRAAYGYTSEILEVA